MQFIFISVAVMSFDLLQRKSDTKKKKDDFNSTFSLFYM